jgi:uncharacterized repeat protein (TIGR01451 family)
VRATVAVAAALAGLALVALAARATPALAAAPAWRLDVVSNTTAAPGSIHTFYVQVTNTGDAAASGASDPIIVAGRLPSGMSIAGATAPGWDCSDLLPGAQAFSCRDASNTIPANSAAGFRVLTFQAAVSPSAVGTLTSSFTVTGGEELGEPVPAASTVDPLTIADVPPPFGVEAFDGTVLDAAGAPYTRAGGHPYAATVSIDFNTRNDPAPLRGDLWPASPVKDVLADLPPGLVGNPTAADQCTAAQLASGGVLARTLCPAAAQVGVALVRLKGDRARNVLGPIPVFNLVPPPDVPARFGFNVAGTIVTLDGALRSDGDYGLSVRVRNIPQGLAIAGTTLTFWGVPAEPSHDAERACPGQQAPWEGGPRCGNGAALKAFLRNPTSCGPAGVGLPVSVSVDSWAEPGVFRDALFISHLPPGYPFPPTDWGPQQGVTDCDAVPFDPGLSVVPASAAAGAPSGSTFALTLPQPFDPDVPGESDVRRAVIRLPLGVRVNPSAADGLQACTPAQVGLGSLADVACPDGSRVGSLEVVTPLLDEPLTGGVYLAAPHDNPFDSLLAVYLVARGPGLIVKLAGRVESDPLGGQVTAVFDDVPQLPFSAVRLVFDGGPRAVLVNPPLCGRYEATGELTGWSGAFAPVSGGFSVSSGVDGAGCLAAGAARPFAPGFAAGVESNGAGTSSPFHLRLTRGDADEELRRVTVRLPRGLLGRIADVVLCSAADAAAGTCGDGSLVGHVVAGAGAGPLPFYLSGGRVYVTGPTGGAPFGLSVVVPAVAGPFDLGTVVVRAALFVDRRTAAVRVVTDPLPVELQGIPLQVRDVRVAVDRPGFMLNPTGCGEKAVRGVVESVSGRVAGVGSRFAASECGALPFDPRLRLIVGSRGHTGARVSTPLTAVLAQRPGEAGIRRVRVTLPTLLSARLDVVNAACTPSEFDAGRCEAARVGNAVASTPLLRDPLRGGMYLVRSSSHPLPDLVIALRGQVDFDLVGRVAIPGSRHLSATFGAVPDVPVSRVVLRFWAGRRGVVGAAKSLCRARAGSPSAVTLIRGQNDAGGRRGVRLSVRGCGAD